MVISFKILVQLKAFRLTDIAIEQMAILFIVITIYYYQQSEVINYYFICKLDLILAVDFEPCFNARETGLVAMELCIILCAECGCTYKPSIENCVQCSVSSLEQSFNL